MSKVLHLCVSNRSHIGLDLLLASSSRVPHLQSRVLGLGSSAPIGHGGKGFGLKLQLLKKELELLPPLQIVLFTDAWDVVLQGTTDRLVDWIETHPGKVLFAAETTKWPDVNLLYPVPLQFPFPFLNSGTFAGRTQDLLTLLQKPFTLTTDDQQFYAEQFCTQTSAIVLDHKAEHFLCMHGLARADVSVSGSRVFHKHSTVCPFVLHLNNGFTRMKWFPFVAQVVLGDAHVLSARRIVFDSALSGLWQVRIALLCLCVFLMLMLR